MARALKRRILILSVLFVGPIWPGSTCVSRLNAIKCLGNVRVDNLDDSLWLPATGRLLRSFVQRTFTYPSVLKMNWRLISAALGKKYDLIWIEKGEWIYPLTLFFIKKTDSLLIHYNTDDVYGSKNHFWLHRLGIRFYDLYLTTNRHNVIEIANKYNIPTIRVGMGYDDHYVTQEASKKVFDIVFIGHWEPHTELYIMALKKAGLCVSVWGYNWGKASDTELKSTIPLPQSQYVQTIAQSKIALCSLSRWNRNESTGRSFEIPAIGTLLLAEYSHEHNYIYQNGLGAALFAKDKLRDLVDMAKFYLKNDEILSSVAKQGNNRSIEPGYSWGQHMQREWPLILDRLSIKSIYADINQDYPFWTGYRNGIEAPRHALTSCTLVKN